MLAPRVRDLGHEVWIYSPGTLGSASIYKGITLLTGRDTQMGGAYYGAEMIQDHANFTKADIVLTYKDPYAFPPHIMKDLTTPWIALCPVDTIALGQLNRATLRYAAGVIAVSKSGQTALAEAGVKPIFFAPHGINTKTFAPVNPQRKLELREELHLPADGLVYLFVGDNRTNPSRKCLDQLLFAWAMYVEKHPEDVLMLHTDVTADRGGIDAELRLTALGVPPTSVRTTPQYFYVSGLNQQALAKLYQASDALLLPSEGEGFGLPLIEAQACGLDVLATQTTAMDEHVFSGIKLNSDNPNFGEPRYDEHIGGMRWRPSQRAILMGMEAMRDRLLHPSYKPGGAVELVRAFDIDTVTELFWKPSLADIERWIVRGEQR